VLWQSGWTPFSPKDYEECTESAAKSAKSKEALAILVSSCNSKFVGRRNVRGGYTDYDSRQNAEFNIAGPNPTAEEWAYIEKEYAKYLDVLAEAEEVQRRSDLQRQQQVAIAEAEQARKLQLARADLARRRQNAHSRISVTSTNLICLYLALDLWWA
jgi:hypothetical protein